MRLKLEDSVIVARGGRRESSDTSDKESKMKRQKNYSQLKEQEKSPERTNNETELTSPSDPEFKSGNKNN